MRDDQNERGPLDPATCDHLRWIGALDQLAAEVATMRELVERAADEIADIKREAQALHDASEGDAPGNN